MLAWSHALPLSLLVVLCGAIAARWAPLDSARSTRPGHPCWLLGPLFVVWLGAADVGWALHHRSAGVEGLRLVYELSVLPAALAVALAAGLTCGVTSGRSAWACAALMLSALVAAAVIRLDTRVLQFVTDSNNAAIRGWFIDRLIPVWPWRAALTTLSGGLLAASMLLSVLQRPRRLSGVLTAAAAAAVVVTGVALSSAWGEVADPGARAALAGQRMPVLEAPGPLARPVQAGLTIDEPGAPLSTLALSPPLRILVALPGTETLPEALRWTGWREVTIAASDDPDAIHMFGAAGQVWIALAGVPQAHGSLSHAPARLSALGITGTVTIQPGIDWTLGDLAALCVSVGGDCALRSKRTQAAQL